MKLENRKTIYTASYTQPSKEAVGGKVSFKFVGKGMQMEFKTFNEILEELIDFKKTMNSKGIDIEIKIYKHDVEEINLGF